MNAAFALYLLVVGCPQPSEHEVIIYRKTTVVDFADEVIESETLRPEAFIRRAAQARRDRLLDPPRDFRQALLQSWRR